MHIHACAHADARRTQTHTHARARSTHAHMQTQTHVQTRKSAYGNSVNVWHRKRTLVSVGTHDLDTVKGPFKYDAVPRKDINFVPLKEEQVHLLRGLPVSEVDWLYSKDVDIFPESCGGKR